MLGCLLADRISERIADPGPKQDAEVFWYSEPDARQATPERQTGHLDNGRGSQ